MKDILAGKFATLLFLLAAMVTSAFGQTSGEIMKDLQKLDPNLDAAERVRQSNEIFEKHKRLIDEQRRIDLEKFESERQKRDESLRQQSLKLTQQPLAQQPEDREHSTQLSEKQQDAKQIARQRKEDQNRFNEQRRLDEKRWEQFRERAGRAGFSSQEISLMESPEYALRDPGMNQREAIVAERERKIVAAQQKLDEEKAARQKLQDNRWRVRYLTGLLLFDLILGVSLAAAGLKTGAARVSAICLLCGLFTLCLSIAAFLSAVGIGPWDLQTNQQPTAVERVRAAEMANGSAPIAVNGSVASAAAAGQNPIAAGDQQNNISTAFGVMFFLAGYLSPVFLAFYGFGRIGTVIDLSVGSMKTTRLRILTILAAAFGFLLFYLGANFYLVSLVESAGETPVLIVRVLTVTGIVSSFLIAGFGIITAYVRQEPEESDLYGSARFASGAELAEFERELEPGGFILAPADPAGKHRQINLPRMLAVMHVLIFGGPGTGKSSGFAKQNCADARNTSIVVTDPKSELWNETSGYHKRAVRYAPLEPEKSFCFNWIPLCADARIAQLCATAIATAGNTARTDQFWINAEVTYLTAVFAHAATTEFPTPLTAYNLITGLREAELLKILHDSPSQLARRKANIYQDSDPRVKGSMKQAVADTLSFMDDERIQLFTSASAESPNFGNLRHQPTAVYWCLREQDIVRLRPLTSLFFTLLLEQIAGETIDEGKQSVPIQLILDEFGNIGKIPNYENILTLSRGRGVGIAMFLQSRSQLNQVYGDHAAQIIGDSCAVVGALHGLDIKTAEYISKMLGDSTVVKRKRSWNFAVNSVSMNRHDEEYKRELMKPDEVMRLGKNEALFKVSNRFPLKLYKGFYNRPPRTAPVTQMLNRVKAVEYWEEERNLLL